MSPDPPLPSTPGSAEITRKAKSNLAAAFACLPADRRKDIVTLYAFCRQVDDIADHPHLPPAEKASRLALWKKAVAGDGSPAGPLGTELADVRDRRKIDPNILTEIISAMEMDITPIRYQTFDDLLQYCYRAASAVGLASIEIFGYQNPACRQFAVNLGYALQLTNILRDIGQDLDAGRIYLPVEDCQRFGYHDDDFLARRDDDRFQSLVRYQADRIRNFHALADQCLPREDRKNMRAARVMSQVYREILDKMERGGFHVFHTRYRLTKPRLLYIIASHWIRAKLHLP